MAQDLDRVLELLWERAEGGNVSAQKALYEHYRNDEDEEAPVEDDWAAIYGEKVTPIRRSA